MEMAALGLLYVPVAQRSNCKTEIQHPMAAEGGSLLCIAQFLHFSMLLFIIVSTGQYNYLSA